MLGELEIAGFKRYDEDGATLRLAPITLLLGANSAGKSSVLQMLLCLAQSWDRLSGFYRLAPTGRLADLGRFAGVVHKGNGASASAVRLRLDGVSFVWEDDEASARHDGEPSSTRHGTLASVQVRHAPGAPVPVDWHFQANAGDLPTEVVFTLERRSIEAWVSVVPESAHLLQPLLLADSPATISWRMRDDEGLLSPSLHPLTDAAVRDLADHVGQAEMDPNTLWGSCRAALKYVIGLRRRLRSTAHVAGLRDRGQRTYVVRDEDRPWRVGPSGSRNWCLAALVNRHPSDNRRTPARQLESIGV